MRSRSEECGMWNEECGRWNVEGGMWKEKCNNVKMK